MKAIVFFASVILATTAQAASPFTWSGEVIQTIFQSPLIWRKLAGEVEKIQYVGHAKNSLSYSLSTTEGVAIVDAAGRTTGWRKVPCTIVVEVTNTGDGFTPKLEVTNVDFTACPETSIKSSDERRSTTSSRPSF